MRKTSVILIAILLLIGFGLKMVNVQLWSSSLGVSWWIILLILLIPTIILLACFIYKKRSETSEIEEYDDEKVVIDERIDFIIQKTNGTTIKIVLYALIGGGLLLSVLKVNDPENFIFGFHMVLLGISGLWVYIVLFMYYFHKY